MNLSGAKDPNFGSDGLTLVPAIIQDLNSGAVLMLGYMNQAAYEQTRSSGLVTFFSRSKGRLWTKGESSGNNLAVKSIHIDCDQDAILVVAEPKGPTCHSGEVSCFGDEYAERTARQHGGFLKELEQLLITRKAELPEGSYTAKLFKRGRQKIAQKVGEEAVELILEIFGDDQLFHEEAADLLFHYMVLLVERGSSLEDVIKLLRKRNVKP